jgi:hypothetical protein
MGGNGLATRRINGIHTYFQVDDQGRQAAVEQAGGEFSSTGEEAAKVDKFGSER